MVWDHVVPVRFRAPRPAALLCRAFYFMYIDKKDLNIEITLFGGQSFVWSRYKNGYLLQDTKNIVYLEDLSGKYKVHTLFSLKDFDVLEYFNLNHLYDHEISVLKKDKYLSQAIDKLSGLRVLKQDFESTFFTFLLSSNNNLQRIRKSSKCLIEKFGPSVKIGSEKIKLFPDSQILSSLDENELLSCGAGYRSKYIIESAKQLTITKEEILFLKEYELVRKLKEFKGVGDKVADCVAIFSGRAKRFSPIDVWAKRILKNLYKIEFNKYDEYRKWFDEKFQDKAYLAGQFLFEYYRQKH